VYVIRASDVYRAEKEIPKKHDILTLKLLYNKSVIDVPSNIISRLLTLIRILSIRLRRDGGAKFQESRAIVEICERAIDAKSPLVVVVSLGELSELEAREHATITCPVIIFEPHEAAGNHSHTAGASNLAVGSFQLRESRISWKRER
jgi:hypothetical protein